jgi:hypothetical protein
MADLGDDALVDAMLYPPPVRARASFLSRLISVLRTDDNAIFAHSATDVRVWIANRATPGGMIAHGLTVAGMVRAGLTYADWADAGYAFEDLPAETTWDDLVAFAVTWEDVARESVTATTRCDIAQLHDMCTRGAATRGDVWKRVARIVPTLDRLTSIGATAAALGALGLRKNDMRRFALTASEWMDGLGLTPALASEIFGLTPEYAKTYLGWSQADIARIERGAGADADIVAARLARTAIDFAGAGGK